MGMASPPIHAAASKGSRVTARNLPKITAPAMIMKTMQEIRTVSPTAAGTGTLDLAGFNQTIGTAARQTVLERFTIQAMARNVEKVYDATTGGLIVL